METKNNKYFFEECQRILERLYARMSMRFDNDYNYFVEEQPSIFDSMQVYILLSSMKREIEKSLSSLEDLYKSADERLLNGLDL